MVYWRKHKAEVTAQGYHRLAQHISAVASLVADSVFVQKTATGTKGDADKLRRSRSV